MTSRRGSTGEPVRVCFVCRTNIARSPMAEAALRELARGAGLLAMIDVDSAATSTLNVGDAVDSLAVDAAMKQGVHIAHRAREFARRDFDEFDLIVVMDLESRTEVLRLVRHGDDAAKVRLLRSFDPDAHGAVDIDDPTYGGPVEFDRAFAEIKASCVGVLAYLREEYLDRG